MTEEMRDKWRIVLSVLAFLSFVALVAFIVTGCSASPVSSPFGFLNPANWFQPSAPPTGGEPAATNPTAVEVMAQALAPVRWTAFLLLPVALACALFLKWFLPLILSVLMVVGAGILTLLAPAIQAWGGLLIAIFTIGALVWVAATIWMHWRARKLSKLKRTHAANGATPEEKQRLETEANLLEHIGPRFSIRKALKHDLKMETET